MFDIFFQMLQHDEQIKFTITRKGDQLSVLIQPVLQGMTNDKADDAAQNIRAALAMPLYITTTPASLDCNFPQCLADFATARTDLHDEFGALMNRLKEAGKQAKVQAANAEEKSTASGQKSAPLVDSNEEDEELDKSVPVVLGDNKSLF